LGLTLTKGNVIELGSGDGSTELLRKYCNEHKRNFYSYDSNKSWCEKTGATYISDWDEARIWNPCSLLFIDHAPGEHRKFALKRMKDKAEIIVVHDTELNGGGDYGFEPYWSLFKYVIHYNRTGGGAGATMCSNFIDVTKHKKLDKYIFE
jgi:hypothetical protein